MDKNKQNENDVQDQTGAQGASGAEEQQDGVQENQQQQTGGTEPKEKTFTQKQVNQMMAREKKQGRSSAFQELGVNPDDAKMLAMIKALVDSTKTDEQKQQEQQAQANAKVAEAEQKAMLAEAKAEAMQFGVQAQYVDDVVTLAVSKMSDNTDLKTILGELKTKYPVWFTTDDDNDEGDKGQSGTQATGQKGTGASVKGSDKNKGTGVTAGLGKRLAAQRKSGAGKKTSFWG